VSLVPEHFPEAIEVDETDVKSREICEVANQSRVQVRASHRDDAARAISWNATTTVSLSVAWCPDYSRIHDQGHQVFL